MNFWIACVALLPLSAAAQLLSFESGIATTASAVTLQHELLTERAKVVLPGFQAQLGIGLFVSNKLRIESGVRRVDYNVGFRKSMTEADNIIYRQALWQVPLVLRGELFRVNKISSDGFGGVNAMIVSREIVSSPNSSTASYNGKTKEFGFEAGVALLYNAGRYAFAVQYRYIRPVNSGNQLEFRTFEYPGTHTPALKLHAVSRMAMHTVGLSFRREL